MLYRCLALLLGLASSISVATASPLFERALVLFKGEKYGQAAELFEQGLKSEEDGLARYYLAESWRKLGRPDTEIADQYRKAITAAPDSIEGANARERLEDLRYIMKEKVSTIARAKAVAGKDLIGRTIYPSGRAVVFCANMTLPTGKTFENSTFPSQWNVLIYEYTNAPSKREWDPAVGRSYWSGSRMVIRLSIPFDELMKYRFLSSIQITPSELLGMPRSGHDFVKLEEDTSGRCKSKNPW